MHCLWHCVQRVELSIPTKDKIILPLHQGVVPLQVLMSFKPAIDGRSFLTYNFDI